ncbi:HipA family kinase [Bosea sp. AK1]|uniref:HipA family kinase n=1 Tax=Bosea sp. AK1 TaxID=2587160 RepID=UPI00114FDD9D|nr:HipA family kinase [Bosea sp. AK1]
MGNPQGFESLVCELIAGELACWLGLYVPPFSVVRVVGIDIPMRDRGHMEHGPAFISQKIPGAPSDAGDTFLRKIANPQDVAKLVAFDTLIRNGDRWPPDDTRQSPNFDNLFFSPSGRKFILCALDHSHCFVETTFDNELDDDYVISDDRIYGYFPHFAPYLRPVYVVNAANRLGQMTREVAAEIVDSVPREWGLTGRQRARFIDVICARAVLAREVMLTRLEDKSFDLGQE